jgi:hypothetical protein
MKIRINGNSLRIRLSQTEIKTLVLKGEISSVCQFINDRLVYTLKHGDYPQLTADFIQGVITIYIPQSLVQHWDKNETIGFDGKDTSGLYILIEKDFQCLKPRQHEDESDLYTNPQSTVSSHD